jgi:tight adherence protein C
MTLLLIALSLACVGGAAWIVATDLLVGRAQRAAAARVAGYGRAATAAAHTVDRPRRLDLSEPLAALTLRIAPGRDRVRTAGQLQAAGFGAGRVEGFLALKSGLALAGLVVGLAAGAVEGGPAVVLFPLAAAAVAFLVPDVLLARRARGRRARVLQALPNALDLIAVVVEAGLGLDAALARYADRAEGALADELSLVVAELRVGSSRADAFRGLAERVPAPEMQAFVRAITTADHLGISLARTLRVQASDARVRRQTLAEQRANKTPVKILFPTVLCIFPALFVVVLAPALLSLLHT